MTLIDDLYETYVNRIRLICTHQDNDRGYGDMTDYKAQIDAVKEKSKAVREELQALTIVVPGAGVIAFEEGSGAFPMTTDAAFDIYMQVENGDRSAEVVVNIQPLAESGNVRISRQLMDKIQHHTFKAARLMDKLRDARKEYKALAELHSIARRCSFEQDANCTSY